MKIVFLGDIMLGENLLHQNRGIKTKFKNKYFDLISEKVKNELFIDADIVCFNLECSLINFQIQKKEHPLNKVYIAEEESLNIFSAFNGKLIANIANNHFSQHGSESSNLTREILIHHGIGIIGGIQKDPLLINSDSQNIFFWGVSLVHDKYYCNEYWFASEEELKSHFSSRKKNTKDFWILSIHWGDEYIEYPSNSQTMLAQSLIDLGIDLIIGHHPHVVQTIEKYKGKFIFYSLGNFIFDQNFSSSTTHGLVLKYNTSNSMDTKVYITNQVRFVVKNLTSKTIDEFFIKKKVNYTKLLKKRKTAAKYKMKIEYLVNILFSDYKTFLSLIKRFFLGSF